MIGNLMSGAKQAAESTLSCHFEEQQATKEPCSCLILQLPRFTPRKRFPQPVKQHPSPVGEKSQLIQFESAPSALRAGNRTAPPFLAYFNVDRASNPPGGSPPHGIPAHERFSLTDFH